MPRSLDDAIRTAFMLTRRPLHEVVGSPWLGEQVAHRVSDDVGFEVDVKVVVSRLVELIDGPAIVERPVPRRA